MKYTIDHHTHNFAVWAASTAASASRLCRFEVRTGKLILEGSGFTPEFTITRLPSPKNFDKIHAIWRTKIIAEAKKNGKEFTHGVAAKLINCYLKSRFICAGNSKCKLIDHIHPPIDSLLLRELAKIEYGINNGKEWRTFEKWRWSKFTSQQYESVISTIKGVMKEKPLWSIEQYWPMHV